MEQLSSCSKRGSCQGERGSFSCLCEKGFTGPQCNQCKYVEVLFNDQDVFGLFCIQALQGAETKWKICWCGKITSPCIKWFCTVLHRLLVIPSCIFHVTAEIIETSPFLCFWLASGSGVFLRRSEPRSAPARVVSSCTEHQSPDWGSDACRSGCPPQLAVPGAERIPTLRGESWPVTRLHLSSCDCLVCEP